jgi:hypothetical protein
MTKRCLDCGDDDVLRKPIATGPLLNAMGKMMAKGGPGGVTRSQGAVQPTFDVHPDPH